MWKFRALKLLLYALVAVMVLTIYAGADMMVRRYYIKQIEKNWEMIERFSAGVRI